MKSNYLVSCQVLSQATQHDEPKHAFSRHVSLCPPSPVSALSASEWCQGYSSDLTSMADAWWHLSREGCLETSRSEQQQLASLLEGRLHLLRGKALFAPAGIAVFVAEL